MADLAKILGLVTDLVRQVGVAPACALILTLGSVFGILLFTGAWLRKAPLDRLIAAKEAEVQRVAAENKEWRKLFWDSHKKTAEQLARLQEGDAGRQQELPGVASGVESTSPTEAQAAKRRRR